MNPSAQDWIKKFLSTYKEDVSSLQFTPKSAFYDLLKATGFLYGNANSLILKHDIDLALSHGGVYQSKFISCPFIYGY